jgi:diguanylate cyclase (GGDEF)-like protein
MGNKSSTSTRFNRQRSTWAQQAEVDNTPLSVDTLSLSDRPEESVYSGAGIWQRHSTPYKTENEPNPQESTEEEGISMPPLLNDLVGPQHQPHNVGKGEPQREVDYQEQVISLYRSRLRLIGASAVLLLPVTTTFCISFMPDFMPFILGEFAVLFLYAAVLRVFVGKLTTLTQMRLTSFMTYIIFSTATATMIAIAGANMTAAYGILSLILLSALLLPFVLFECLAVIIITTGALAWVGWWNPTPDGGQAYSSNIYLMVTTAAFVLGISSVQKSLHRQAFDATFEVLHSNYKLQALSFLDPLTGGFNRRYLETMLNVEISRALRFKRPISIIMFDLDNFKQINDQCGHLMGDVVLREVWKAAASVIRDLDTAARFGGDEFAIVLPDADERAAYLVARRLKEEADIRLQEVFKDMTCVTTVTLSIGIYTTNPTDGITPEELIERADVCLYDAKRDGKNRIVSSA